MDKIKVKDVIAVTILWGAIVLHIYNNNPALDIAVASIIGYYFGRRHTE